MVTLVRPHAHVSRAARLHKSLREEGEGSRRAFTRGNNVGDMYSIRRNEADIFQETRRRAGCLASCIVGSSFEGLRAKIDLARAPVEWRWKAARLRTKRRKLRVSKRFYKFVSRSISFRSGINGSGNKCDLIKLDLILSRELKKMIH